MFIWPHVCGLCWGLNPWVLVFVFLLVLQFVCMCVWTTNEKPTTTTSFSFINTSHTYTHPANNQNDTTPTIYPPPAQAETIYYYVLHMYIVWRLLWSVGRCGSTVVAVGVCCCLLLLAAKAHKLQLHTHLPVLNCLTTNTKWPFSFIFMIPPILDTCVTSQQQPLFPR